MSYFFKIPGNASCNGGGGRSSTSQVYGFLKNPGIASCNYAMRVGVRLEWKMNEKKEMGHPKKHPFF